MVFKIFLSTPSPRSDEVVEQYERVTGRKAFYLKLKVRRGVGFSDGCKEVRAHEGVSAYLAETHPSFPKMTQGGVHAFDLLPSARTIYANHAVERFCNHVLASL